MNTNQQNNNQKQSLFNVNFKGFLNYKESVNCDKRVFFEYLLGKTGQTDHLIPD